MKRQVFFLNNKIKKIDRKSIKQKVIYKKYKTGRKENYIAQYIIQHIKNNLKEYITLTIVLLLGICVGIIVVNNIQIEKQQIIKEYILKFIESIKTEYKINTHSLLQATLIKNGLTVLLLWFIGSTIIGLPLIYLIIGYKGFCLGYTISSIIGTLGKLKGILFTCASMLIQNIFYIPIILVLCVSGLKVYKGIIKNKQHQNIKAELVRHTCVSIAMLILIMLATLIESYVSVGLVNGITYFL